MTEAADSSEAASLGSPGGSEASAVLEALRFHELTAQAPFEVWLAISNKAHPPQLEYPPLRIVRFSKPGLTEGVEDHEIDGVPVRISGIARTVADCFKYRTRIAFDVAIEAFREALKEQGGQAGRGDRASIDEIWGYALLDRVANVMRRYLEALA